MEDCAKNTDRELWRERPDDYYADSVHVTEGGGIGINASGRVVVKTPQAWVATVAKLEAAEHVRKAAERTVAILERYCTQSCEEEPCHICDLRAALAWDSARSEKEE